MLHQIVTKQWCLASNEKALVKQKSVIKDKIKKNEKGWRALERYLTVMCIQICLIQEIFLTRRYYHETD